jgi:hypothetical protein
MLPVNEAATLTEFGVIPESAPRLYRQSGKLASSKGLVRRAAPLMASRWLQQLMAAVDECREWQALALQICFRLAP